MTTIGDAMNFVKWLFDFVQMVFSWFNKDKKEEEEPAA